MKKLLLASTIAALMLTGCNKESDTTKIGVTIYKYDDNFMALMRQEIEKEAKALGGIELKMNDSQNQQSIQNDQIDGLLSKGVKALAINLVDAGSAGTVIDKAKSDNVPIVFFNRKPSEKNLNSYDKAYYVGTDPKESGVMQGQLIAKQWKAHPEFDLNKDGKIQYALLKGEPGHPDAEARTEFVIKELNSQGLNTEKLFLDTGMWDAAMAKDKMQSWLSSPQGKEIEVVICNNDGMAMGAFNAIKSAGKQLPIFGVDALPEVLQMIKKGEILGTVLNDGVNQGKAVVQLSKNLAEGKAPTQGMTYKLNGKTINVPYVAVDADNLKDFLK